MTSPVGVTAYSYDANDQLIRLTDPQSNTTTWNYDHIGRMLTQSTTTAAGTVLGTAYSYGLRREAA